MRCYDMIVRIRLHSFLQFNCDTKSFNNLFACILYAFACILYALAKIVEKVNTKTSL